jgi:threonylcarbamoyladenosine tRNA methylthiotransferase MtaB
MNAPLRFHIKTLGCKANFADSQAMEAALIARGFASASGTDEVNLIIVNSCTVTDEAEQQSRRWIRDAKKRNPGAKVVYTGCGAEVDPEGALTVPGIGAVIGNQDKPVAAALIAEWMKEHLETPQILGSVTGYAELTSRHPLDREWPSVEGSAPSPTQLPENASSFRTRAFLKIQEGCDSFCTYCIIPYGRGPARSLSVDSVLGRIEDLIGQGVREVVLTGTNIGDYGLDWSGSLQIDHLIEQILTRTRLERLRIGSLDPTEISSRMLQMMEEFDAFCPHLHVSLQHTESRILRMMKRKYSLEQVQDFFSRMEGMKRKPFIGMDLIAGFPGETEEEALRMQERLQSWSWNRMHVFPYSERAGTPATRLPDAVPNSIRKERARRLQALSLERLTRTYASSGNRDGILSGVLLEGPVKGPDGSRAWISGYSRDYQRVLLPESAWKGRGRNEIVEVSVSRWVVDRASGEVSWIGEVHGA